MFTTSHAFIGFLLFCRKDKKVWPWAVLGAISPDIPQMLTYGIGAAKFFILGQIEYEPLHSWVHGLWVWASVCAVFHSFFLWGTIGLMTFLFAKKCLWCPITQAFFLGGFAHILIDVLTHKSGWIWNYFYPLNVPLVYGIIEYRSAPFLIVEHLAILAVIAFLAKKKYKKRLIVQRAKLLVK